MSKYSLLVIAYNCHISHMTRFISNLKQENPEAEIDLFTDKNKEDLPLAVIDNVNNVFHHKLIKNKGIRGRIWSVLTLRHHFNKLSCKKYDIINIHYPQFYMALVMGRLRKLTQTIVVSPWGSDILRVNGMKFKFLAKYVIDKCDYITTLIDGNIGIKILSYLPESKNKFYPQAWGSETIDFINHHLKEIDTKIAKDYFGLSNRYVITCGYNAFRGQNHKKIIDAIINVRHLLPENLTLLFPVSYGNSDKDQYIEELRLKCNDNNLDAVFVKDYMSVQNVFILRMATDMFVHVQNTDAGCASLQEYILCEKKIVHGDWVKYPMLENYKPLCYHTVRDFTELGRVIIDTYHSAPIIFSEDAIKFIQSNGWEDKRKCWNDMFVELSSKNNTVS